MPQYTPPLRDLQFVMHELLNAADELKLMPAHKDILDDGKVQLLAAYVWGLSNKPPAK